MTSLRKVLTVVDRCFLGFLLSLMWLGEGRHEAVYVFSTPIFICRQPLTHSRTISKWMIYIWFGLDGTGIQRSTEFHWLLGPSLMVTFAFLGNTLFLTILVSMLSNTFSTIVSNATAEVQFRHAVFTLEGVKSDAIFAYQPPFNILALLVLVPLKFVVSPRWFHKIHVFSVRLLNLPLLLIIALVERGVPWPNLGNLTAKAAAPGDGKRSGPRFWEKWRITAHSDIETVFEIPPPEVVLGEEEDDDTTVHMIRRHFTRQTTADTGKDVAAKDSAGEARPGAKRRESSAKTPGKTPSRRDSIAFPGLAQQIRGMLTEHSDDNNVADRLDALEESTARIESLLAKLVGKEGEIDVADAVEDEQEEQEEEEAGKTGTLQDLDHSVHED